MKKISPDNAEEFKN